MVNRRLALVGSTAVVCAVGSVVILLGQDEPQSAAKGALDRASNPPPPPMQAMKAVTVETADASRTAVEPALPQPGVPMPHWAQDTVQQLRNKGFQVPEDLRLASSDAWLQLVDAWEGTSREVSRTYKVWFDTGCKLAAERLENGEFERADSLQYPRPEEGQPDLRPWQLNRDKDWVTVRLRFDDVRDCETYDIVRIVPGDSPALDRAVAERKTALELRRLQMESLLNQ